MTDDDPETNCTVGAGVPSRSYTREAAQRAANKGPKINPQCGSQGLDGDGHCARCGLIPITGDHCPPGFLDPNVEMIVRAAIQYNGTIYSLPAPARHHHVMTKMFDDDLPSEACALQNQGFVTSKDRFVDRYEGCRIARAAGQLWRRPTPDDMLTSEDVW